VCKFYKRRPPGISVGVVACGIIGQDAVRTYRPFIVLLLLLLVAIALPALCFAMPAASTCAGAGEMPFGSHGDHCPAQPRACCQVDHGTPMAVPVARLAAQLASGSAAIVDGHDGLIYAVARFVTANEFSPPPPAVLRI
jgi:hypothetical protein